MRVGAIDAEFIAMCAIDPGLISAMCAIDPGLISAMCAIDPGRMSEMCAIDPGRMSEMCAIDTEQVATENGLLHDSVSFTLKDLKMVVVPCIEAKDF